MALSKYKPKGMFECLGDCRPKDLNKLDFCLAGGIFRDGLPKERAIKRLEILLDILIREGLQLKDISIVKKQFFEEDVTKLWDILGGRLLYIDGKKERYLIQGDMRDILFENGVSIPDFLRNCGKLEEYWKWKAKGILFPTRDWRCYPSKIEFYLRSKDSISSPRVYSTVIGVMPGKGVEARFPLRPENTSLDILSIRAELYGHSKKQLRRIKREYIVAKKANKN